MLVFPFVGWALCAATMGLGMAFASQQNALIIHAILAPIYFAALSLIYFRRFNYSMPLATAVVWVTFVMTMDFFVVAVLVLRSLEMFTSILGTWIPFALIFLSVYLTGWITTRRPGPVGRESEHSVGAPTH
jgi:hypothetical protein